MGLLALAVPPMGLLGPLGLDRPARPVDDASTAQSHPAPPAATAPTNSPQRIEHDSAPPLGEATRSESPPSPWGDRSGPRFDLAVAHGAGTHAWHRRPVDGSLLPPGLHKGRVSARAIFCVWVI